jgi:2-iminobutanoate/2-iminopropanoate deaminase
MGARVGNTIFTSGVAGKLPATNKLVDGAEAQAYQAFENLKTVLANGGATLAHVGLISALVADEAARDALNKAWVDAFPDANDRPARHTTVQPLRGGMLVQIQAIAVVTD